MDYAQTEHVKCSCGNLFRHLNN